jgi:hypothetical protein
MVVARMVVEWPLQGSLVNVILASKLTVSARSVVY